jgi:hypothetical protein
MQLCPATLVASGAWPNLLWRIDMDSLPEVTNSVKKDSIGKKKHPTRRLDGTLRSFCSEVICHQCGHPYDALNWVVKLGATKYCSKRCSAIANGVGLVGDKNVVWNGGRKASFKRGYRTDKNTARMATYRARKKMDQIPPCSVCGDTIRVEAHHPDYRFPAVFVWLCRKCHTRHHTIERRERNGVRP